MPGTPFREILTLSDAVELVGRRLYDETWTGSEYLYSQSQKSPEEIARERKPLEEELCAAIAKLRQIEAEIGKAMGDKENRRLAASRNKLETQIRQLHARLSFDHPLNDIVRDAYSAHLRWKTANETFLEAVKGFSLKVHDGRGRELNPLAWSSPKFRCYLDLSIVVNPKTAGAPRWQAARIDRDKFNNWLATLKPIVEAKHERSTEDRLREFLRQQVAAAKDGPHKPKDVLRKEARARVPEGTGRMFDRVWSNVVPQEWCKGGAPRKPRKVG